MTHRLVCIGGGTGLFTLLSGMKEACPAAHLSAIVSMADSGGSTGRLRDEYGHLPAGDIRKCLVALSHAPQQLRQLMEYRFPKGELSGHSFGNLWLTVLKETLPGSKEENEYDAITVMEEILHIKDNVFPVTLTDCHLHAELEDGTLIKGETNIDVPSENRPPIKHVHLHPEATLFAKVEDAIAAADAIVIGPGDLYTSVIPNLIVQGMSDALAAAQERGAKIYYVVNTMTKNGETNDYPASEFVRRIEAAISPAAINGIILNIGEISEEQARAYENESSFPVQDDLDDDRVTRADLVSTTEYARHDPRKLATAFCEVLD